MLVTGALAVGMLAYKAFSSDLLPRSTVMRSTTTS